MLRSALVLFALAALPAAAQGGAGTRGQAGPGPGAPQGEPAGAGDRDRIQDRDGAGPVLQASRRPFPFIRKAFADAGYQGPRVAEATSIAVEIVKRKPDQVGFAVQPRRWVVERFFAWISRNRRLWKDAEATIGSATAFLYAAAVMILIRRIARQS